MRKGWMERAWGVAGAVVLVAGAVGCASAGAESDADGRGRSVTVLVTNHNWQDATVYVIGAGPRVRLGTVTSMNSQRFVVPPSVRRVTGFRLEADLIGSSVRKTTSDIIVNPGEEVRWNLENQLALSSYSVW